MLQVYGIERAKAKKQPCILPVICPPFEKMGDFKGLSSGLNL